MHTYTVTIGRNVGTTPMPERDWAAFQRQVEYALSESLGWGEPYPERHTGVGVWDGVTEESFKVTAFTNYPADPYSVSLLRDRLAVLAGDYNQDAIALTLGESELVTPRRHGIPNIGGIGATVGEGVTA